MQNTLTGHLPSGVQFVLFFFIDCFWYFAEHQNGNKYAKVFTYHFIKYTEVFAVSSQQTDVCALQIVNAFIARFDYLLPVNINLGANFEIES
jgi:hypothetical protein